MINGEFYKQELQDDILNIESIPVTITEEHIKFSVLSLNKLFDEIITELGNDTITEFMEWSDYNYDYDDSELKIFCEKPADLTIENIRYKIKTNMLQLWVYLCEYAIEKSIFINPVEGILL